MRVVACYLQGNNVFRLRAFLALSNGELNLLAFCQGLETAALNSAEVNEYVGAAFTSDKAEALGFVEELDGTGNCRHIF